MSGKSERQLRFEHTQRRKPVSKVQQRLRNWGIGIAVVVAVVGIVVLANRGSDPGAGAAGSTPGAAMDMGQPNAATHGSSLYPYAIGDPGVGKAAPEIKLQSTAGGTFDLSSYAGKAPVLLYFQEGLTCQPCWDQIVALQKDMPAFRALGIDTIVSITNDPYAQLKQKAVDEGLTIPVLADPDGSVCNQYGTLRYGMMMGMNPGHTFILVGKDGRIAWRADYGGPPKYTMYLPPTAILQDLQAGLGVTP
jgi:peroxiredoxin Q/BCP